MEEGVPQRLNPRLTADGIYGIIISAGVLASWRGSSLIHLAVAALATLLIYWAAERYARVIAERVEDGRRPTLAELRHEMSRGWEIVTTSFLPLVVLLVSTLLGAKKSTAVLDALITSTILLCLAGWAVGRNGQLTTTERVVSALVAGTFGFAMILLKTSLH
jgi:positive regulator of sigma E activity